jgi:hypothetical protein
MRFARFSLLPLLLAACHASNDFSPACEKIQVGDKTSSVPGIGPPVACSGVYTNTNNPSVPYSQIVGDLVDDSCCCTQSAMPTQACSVDCTQPQYQNITETLVGDPWGDDNSFHCNVLVQGDTIVSRFITSD